MVRKYAGKANLLASGAVMLLGGVIFSAPGGFREFYLQGIGEITFGIAGGILYLRIISTALAMFLWNYAFAELTATVSSLTFFAQPFVGALPGGVLIGIGILISTRETSRRARRDIEIFLT